jgi:hypothetical protein
MEDILYILLILLFFAMTVGIMAALDTLKEKK